MNEATERVLMSGESNFKVGLVVREQIILAKFWSKPEDEQVEVLVGLLDTFNTIFGMETEFEFHPGDVINYAMTGGGNYDPEEKTIHLYKKTSVLTFLFMVGNALSQNGFKFVNVGFNGVPSWAHTIFCLASRKNYFQGIASGDKFVHNDVPLLAPLGELDGSRPSEEEVSDRYEAAMAMIEQQATLVEIATSDDVN